MRRARAMGGKKGKRKGGIVRPMIPEEIMARYGGFSFSDFTSGIKDVIDIGEKVLPYVAPLLLGAGRKPRRARRARRGGATMLSGEKDNLSVKY